MSSVTGTSAIGMEHNNIQRSSVTGCAEIGRLLDNISPRTVARLIELKLIKATKLPGRGKTTPWRVSREELARFREVMRTGEIAQHLEAAEQNHERQ
jgi:hypothetical protein